MGLLGTSWDDPQTLAVMQLAGGLLSGGNFGQALGKGLVGYTGQLNQAGDRKLQEAQMEQARAKAEEYQRQVAASKATGQRDALFQDAVSRGATPQQLAQYFPDKVDLIKKLADAPNFGRQAVARTIEVEGPNGMKMIRQADQYGNPVGEDVAGYTPPQLINQGDKQTFAKPVVGQTFAIGMSPAERDASARGWAGNSIAQKRLEMDQNQLAQPKPTFHDGQWITPPTAQNPQGTVVTVPGSAPKLTESESKNTLYLSQMRDASKVIDKIGDTSSPVMVAAAGSPYTNWMAGESSQKAAQARNQWAEAYLRVKTGAAATAGEVENNIRTFFPVVGDSDAVIRQKALARKEVEKAMLVPSGRGADRLGAVDGQPANAPVMNAKPVANSSNKGRVIHETDANGRPTGKTFKSNGLQWVEQ